MKVIFTNLFLIPGKVGGAEHYVKNLLKGFSKLPLDILLVRNQYDSEPVKFNSLKIKMHFNRGFYDYFLNFFIKKNKANLLFSPNYITALFWMNVKKVTTIHDLQYLHYPMYFSIKKRLWLYLSHLITLYFSDKVICISNYVKRDIVEKFGNKFESKLEVISNPIDFSRFESCDANLTTKFGIKGKYILSVAAQYPHKNLLSLVKAFKSDAIQRTDYKLVLAGQFASELVSGDSEYHKKLYELIDNDEKIIVTGYVNNDVLGSLYSNCDIFVFPSIFEGFGMPVVEAMGFGKPVITSRNCSLFEVTDGKAIYVDDIEDEVELMRVIMNTVDNIASYTDIAYKNKSVIKNKYEPSLIAESYFKLFKSVLNEEKDY